MQEETSQNTGEYQFQTKMENTLNKGREESHLGRGDNPRYPGDSFWQEPGIHSKSHVVRHADMEKTIVKEEVFTLIGP